MPNITKKDLVERIADSTGLTQVDTKIVVESFLDAVSTTLQDGNNIEIRGFGRFKTKKKKARMARNPRTNEQIFVEEGFKPVFESSRELSKRVNDAYIKNESSQSDASDSDSSGVHSEMHTPGPSGL